MNEEDDLFEEYESHESTELRSDGGRESEKSDSHKSTELKSDIEQKYEKTDDDELDPVFGKNKPRRVITRGKIIHDTS